MVPDRAAGEAGRIVDRLCFMRARPDPTRHDQPIGWGHLEMAGEADIHIGQDGIIWGGSLYGISRFAIVFRAAFPGRMPG